MLKNSQRLLVGVIERLAMAQGFSVDKHSHDWILQLRRDGRAHTVFGYDLGLNSSTAHRLANDKSAAFDVLSAHAVPAVEHRVFLHPRFLDFVDAGGNWRRLLTTFDGFGADAVLKDNEGTGGYDVIRVRSEIELEQAALRLFQVARSAALSPFIEIDAEQRFIMLGDSCLLAYGKERPEVVGDGVSSVGALITAACRAGTLQLTPSEIDNPEVMIEQVLPAGRRLPLQWRHNLGRGARAVAVDGRSSRYPADLAVARKAMAALSLEFASVDLIDVGGVTLVLEVNSGVMLEMLARTMPDGVALAELIYRAALLRLLGRKVTD